MKQKIINLLNYLITIQNKLTPKEDKLKHFYWGTIISLITDIFTDNWLIVVLPFVVAIIKEIRDKTKNNKNINLGTVEKSDIFFTTLSGLILYLIKFL